MKKFITILIAICLTFSLTGCIKTGTAEDPLYNKFVRIQNEEKLYYDINTNIVYLIRYGSDTASFMSPYYASNGFPYVYNVELNKLEEINIIENMIKW